MFKILADENIDYGIIKHLRDKGFNIISVFEISRGIPDKDVIKLAKKHNCILLTEDSDFGEWVFSFQEKELSVIFLRYKQEELEKIKVSIVAVVNKYGNELYGKFTVITVKKIRMREIF